MTEEDYHKKMEEIKARFETEKRRLYAEYGLSQSKFKIGDIIKDSRWAFKIDKITVSKIFDLPEPVYHGYELKKDLTPRKDLNRVTIHGNKCELVSKAQ